MSQPKRTTSYEDYKRKKRVEEAKKMKKQIDKTKQSSAEALPKMEDDKDVVATVAAAATAKEGSTMHSRVKDEEVVREFEERYEEEDEERGGSGFGQLAFGILCGLLLISLAFALPHLWSGSLGGGADDSDGSGDDVVASLEDVNLPGGATSGSGDGVTDGAADGSDGNAAADGDGAVNGNSDTGSGNGAGSGSGDGSGSGSGTGTGTGSGAGSGTGTGSGSGSSSGSGTTQAVATPTTGDWKLLYVNKEEFEIDDEDDDVTEIEIKDVCKSIYRQNSNVVSYCDETSKLRSATASSLGASRCEGNGGSCGYGRTCLLWNAREDEDGDIDLFTAMYRCE